MISYKADIVFFCGLVALIVIFASMVLPPSVQMQNQEFGNTSPNASQTQDSINSNEAANSECKIVNYLPDPNCTPGATDPRVNQDDIKSTICVSGYTSTVRPPVSVTNKIKVERMQAYGFTDSMSNYELDHFIPLELGGSPDSIQNLFPESYANPYGAKEKDKVENYLHDMVCSGSITLQTAQEEIRSNWVKVYNSCCAAN